MYISLVAITLLYTAASAAAFTPKILEKVQVSQAKASLANELNNERPLFDPFGLYPKNSPERMEGRLQPLEPPIALQKSVKDPLDLYTDKSNVDDKPMSMSLPFLERPPMLDGTVPGDRGFDPFNFASTADSLQWYRTAEVKHSRLAMLAVAGWIGSELFDKPLANMLDLKPLLVFNDRVPSVLNGGLDRTPPAYWAAVLGVAFAIETIGMLKEMNASNSGSKITPGDFGFDPLGLAGKTFEDRMFKAESEIFNGRLAMLAITFFALREWWAQNAIVNEFPIFFKPINVVLEQFQDMVGNHVP
jgi:hypothetical protein